MTRPAALLILLLCAAQAAPPAPDPKPKPAKPAPAPKREMVCRPAHDGTCLACKDCSACIHCSKNKGVCSVCLRKPR